LNSKELQNFNELRNQIIELIGTSKRRVWLMTDYLTDGDIVSALYLAKYRRMDVRVFLGRTKQNDYLSRLNYLKSQNIPVFVRPEHGFVSPTLLFVDQRLYTINRDLNVLQQARATISQASPGDVKSFVTWFRDIIENPELTRPRPEMEVGRPPRSRQGIGDQGEHKDRPNQPIYEGEIDGSFNYDRSQSNRKAPDGVATKLPKVPRWKTIQEKREAGEVEVDNPPNKALETPTAPLPLPPGNPSQNSPTLVPDVQNPATIEGVAPSK
jgi:hypothetical protein